MTTTIQESRLTSPPTFPPHSWRSAGHDGIDEPSPPGTMAASLAGGDSHAHFANLAGLGSTLWGPSDAAYIDELVSIHVNPDPSEQAACEDVYFALRNANYNIMALLDAAGDLVERYEYTPYGQRQVYVSAGANDPLAMSLIHASRRVIVDSVTQPYALNEIGHQGLFHDESDAWGGLVQNRARMLHPQYARFMQRDPLDQNEPGGGYQDGMGLYQYTRSSPLIWNDSSGEAVGVFFTIAAVGYGISKGIVAAYCGYKCIDCLSENQKITQSLAQVYQHDPVKLAAFIQGIQQHPPCRDICKKAGVSALEAVIWISSAGAVQIIKVKILLAI